MVHRADIVAEARRWIGTPFHMQASIRGHGCDCKGLIVGIGRNLGLPEAMVLEAGVANYGSVIDADLLLHTLQRLMLETDVARPGDVLLLKINNKAQHLAIISEAGRMIHCYQNGPGCVIEVPIGKSRPIHSIWTWPSLKGA